MRRLTAALAASAVLLTACGSSEDTSATSTGEDTTSTTGGDLLAVGEKPAFEVDSDAEPPSELVVEDLVVGDGPVAEVGDTVSMHYVGKSWSTGVEFDASWDRGSTFDFTIGEGRVIAGWDEGIPGMQVGGRRKLVIPPDLGYGANGAGSDIGPNETLVFVVDLVAVKKTVLLDPPLTDADRPEFEVDTEAEPPAELVVEDLSEGEGEYEVKPGDTVIVHYVGKAWSDGEEFDASWNRGQTFRFELGAGRVIPGWDQGVAGMKLGQRRKLVIPPDLAYGDAGAGDAIGPGETLVFVVDLVGYVAAEE